MSVDGALFAKIEHLEKRVCILENTLRHFIEHYNRFTMGPHSVFPEVEDQQQ